LGGGGRSKLFIIHLHPKKRRLWPSDTFVFKLPDRTKCMSLGRGVGKVGFFFPTMKNFFLMEPGTIEHACNSNTWEAEAEASWVQKQSGLHSE
jgi:hypothetical protein